MRPSVCFRPSGHFSPACLSGADSASCPFRPCSSLCAFMPDGSAIPLSHGTRFRISVHRTIPVPGILGPCSSFRVHGTDSVPGILGPCSPFRIHGTDSVPRILGPCSPFRVHGTDSVPRVLGPCSPFRVHGTDSVPGVSGPGPSLHVYGPHFASGTSRSGARCRHRPTPASGILRPCAPFRADGTDPVSDFSGSGAPFCPHRADSVPAPSGALGIIRAPRIFCSPGCPGLSCRSGDIDDIYILMLRFSSYCILFVMHTIFAHHHLVPKHILLYFRQQPSLPCADHIRLPKYASGSLPNQTSNILMHMVCLVNTGDPPDGRFPHSPHPA